MVTKPFHFEGVNRARIADAGIQEMQKKGFTAAHDAEVGVASKRRKIGERIGRNSGAVLGALYADVPQPRNGGRFHRDLGQAGDIVEQDGNGRKLDQGREEGHHLILGHREVEGRVYQDAVGAHFSRGANLLVSAPDVRLATADDDRKLAGSFIDNGPDGDFALLVINAGELPGSADDNHAPAAVVDYPAGSFAHRFPIHREIFIQRCQQRGDTASYALLEGRHN